ncbi:ZIP family metal transporter [Bacillus carboniphilus]|uniref:ZIP family metal transporter n=1 Tax=Bacillus carboniphilus TaxID=86663 RepID=UPI0035325E0F
MFQAAFWGAVSGSSILLGAFFAQFKFFTATRTAFIMAFGTGVLIGAASFELLDESYSQGGYLSSSIGFLSGAIIYTIIEFILAKKGGNERKRSTPNPKGHSGLSIFFGTLLDAIPESIIIGVSLLEGGGLSFLMVIAVFISNFPEGLSSTKGLLEDYSKRKIYFLWFMVVVLATASSFFWICISCRHKPSYYRFYRCFRSQEESLP